jgi:AAA+ superfamily predicted ATPase
MDLPSRVTLRQTLVRAGLSAHTIKERLTSHGLTGAQPVTDVPAKLLAELTRESELTRPPEVTAEATLETARQLRLERTRLILHRAALRQRPLETLAHLLPSSAKTVSALHLHLGLQAPPHEAAEELARIDAALARPLQVQSPGELLLRTALGLGEIELDALWLLAAPDVSPRHLALLDELYGRRTGGAVTLVFLRHLLGATPAADEALSAEGVLRRLALLVPVGRGEITLAARALELLIGAGRDGEPALDGIATPLALSARAPALPLLVEAELAALTPGESERIFVTGPEGAGVRALAERLAIIGGRTLIEVDLVALGAAGEHALPVLLRELHLHHALLLLRRGERMAGDALAPVVRARLLAALSHEGIPVVIDAGGNDTLPVLSVFGAELGARHLGLTLPPPQEREALWQDVLERAGVEGETIAALNRTVRAFPIGVDHMVEAVRLGRVASGARGLSVEALRHTCNRMVTHRLGEFAMKLETRSTWNDLVVPDEVGQKIADLVRQAELSRYVLDELGYGRRLSYGRGVTALLAGPSGTGKTMAATLIADHLGVELYRVDLASVISKYIGETEQHLASLFREAASTGAALLFDEADSLFAKRTDVKSSNDRYANLAVNFLLQKFEEHDGLSLLTTNLSNVIDKAFLRRIRFHIEFPEPDEPAREQLWRNMIPAEAPLLDDIDLRKLARAYTLSGGAISNAVLRAAFRSAAADRPLGHADLEQAARDELSTLGRLQWDPR